MGLLNDAAVVNIEGNTKQLVDQINKADKAMQNFDSTLTDILSHLTAVEKGLSNVSHVTNQKGNFFNAPTDSFIGARGTAANYTNTRTKAYKEAQEKYIQIQEKSLDLLDKQIKKEKELARLKSEQADVVKQDSNTRAMNAQSKLLRARAANTAEMLSYYSGLGLKHKELEGFYKYKSAHPERFVAGAQDWNGRYQASKAIRGVGTVVSNFGTGGKLLGNFLDTVGTFVKSPIAGASAAVTNLAKSVVDLGKSAVQSYSEIEAIKTQLGVVFSNQTQADSMFSQISQYAVKSPFGVQQTSELAVLLKQSGVYASDLMDTLRMLGDTAGGNMEKMKRIANNYAQIVSIGKASMLDMRQFAYAGIPIFEAVSKELGVSQQELRKLISDGKVTSDIIEKVFKDLTGINGIFENATEKGAKTLKARLQNLQDARQLAFGSMGEVITNFGTKTGGDSYANKIVTGIENIYSWLQEHVETENIARDVETIANREDRITKLESLIEYNKVWGTPDVVEGLEKILEREKAKRDPEKDRATFVEAYNNARGGFDKLFESGELVRLDELEIKIREQEDKIAKMSRKSFGPFGAGLEAGAVATGLASGNLLGAAAGALGLGNRYESLQSNESINGAKEYLKYLEDLRKAIVGSTEVQKQWIQAVREQSVIDAQQLAFDQANKYANTKESLNYSFNELYEIWKNSDEYKEKEEKERLERLEDAQKTLKEIAKNTEENGNVNFGLMSRSEYQDYKKLGAFVGERKLNVVEGKNAAQLSADRSLLESQFAHNAGVVIEDLMKSPAYSSSIVQNMVKAFKSSYSDLAGATTDEAFFKQFAVTFSEMSNSLDQMAKSDKNYASFYQDLKSYLADATIQWNVRTEGLNANLAEEKKGKELPDYIPLWKRIVASDTGWSAERITTAKEFMKEYLKYSSQQIARGGIQGLANVGMRAGEIGTMLSYTSNVNKQGVRQVDWEKTEQNIYKYALALETPLKRSSAAMNGLADAMKNQVETYRKLTADIYTVGEDWTTINNDIKGQYSVAQGLGNANILDNAFEAFAKESDNFKVQFDEKQGLVVFDKLSNTIVGSVADLKNNQDIKDENLKKYLENIKVDNLVTALDEATRQIEINSQITQVEAEMLNEATKLEAKRLESRVNTYGQSGAVLGALKGSRNEDIAAGALSLTARNDNSTGYKAGKDVNDAVTNILKKISEMDNTQLSSDEYLKSFFTKESFKKGTALDSIRDALNDPNVERFEDALSEFISAFPEVITRILEEATRTEDEIKNDEYTAAADKALRELPLSISDAFRNNVSVTGNLPFGQNMVEALGSPLLKFETLLDDMTKAVKANPLDNGLLIDKYASNMISSVKKEGRNGNLSPEEVEEYSREISRLANDGDLERLEEYVAKIGDGKIWENATRGANKWALSLGNIGNALENISQDTKKLVEDFTSDTITSTFTTWGETLGKGEDASEALSKNFAQMAASMLQNMGSMLTQAGLALAISSIGDKAGVLTGLAIAAAGGGLSFLGGYINGALAEDNKSKQDSEYEKLLRIKQDLADLLKQAREDAIYYENTVRHKKAISANDALTAKSVHDAIITPQGDVVTTDPKDYLIATKTPKSLIGGGAPTINFNVIDKSTGIKVTQQRSTYNESTNTIEFEAIIESKVQEVIASAKGDEAFAARQARLNGRTVIA